MIQQKKEAQPIKPKDAVFTSFCTATWECIGFAKGKTLGTEILFEWFT